MDYHPYTVYWSVGRDASEEVFYHARMYVLLRNEHDPARGKGVGRLIADHNTLYRQTEWTTGT